MKLLRLDASPRQTGSHSRQLADVFVKHWMQQHPSTQCTVRDLTLHPIPHLTQTTITGFYTPAAQHDASLGQAVALSDTLVAELLACDVLLLSTPMYNFGIPSGLKAYIDHIVRPGYTFEAKTQAPLVHGKKAYLMLTTGSTGYTDGKLQGFNHVEPYLRSILGFIGIQDVTTFLLEGTGSQKEDLPSRHEALAQRIAKACNLIQNHLS
jgi:FMN-dependent NADH-azoreductase